MKEVTDVALSILGNVVQISSRCQRKHEANREGGEPSTEHVYAIFVYATFVVHSFYALVIDNQNSTGEINWEYSIIILSSILVLPRNCMSGYIHVFVCCMLLPNLNILISYAICTDIFRSEDIF